MDSIHYQEIKEHIDKIRIIDTHDHLPQEPVRLKQNVDVLATLFFRYATGDLCSAGMPEDDIIKTKDLSVPLEERWKIVEPWWEKIRNTGFSRTIEIAVKGLYGVDGINSDTYMQLSKNMKMRNKEGLYRWVLKERSGIDISVNYTDTIDVDRELFAPVHGFKDFLHVTNKTDLESLGRQVGGPIHTFRAMEAALGSVFDRVVGKIVGIGEIALAYNRSNYFEKVSFSEAEAAFNEIYRVRAFRTPRNPRLYELTPRIPESPGFEILLPMQNYLVHKIVEESEKRRLPIQIHTGLQTGNENIVSNSNPELLINLFMEYKNARFDIFHGGWPYCRELGALAKTFPNVYIDMCWMHSISPSRSRKALSDWLDEVPANKILGFGGDGYSVEGVYGNSVIARKNIARVLAVKVDNGDYSLEQAKKYASWLLRKNAERLFFPNGL